MCVCVCVNVLIFKTFYFDCYIHCMDCSANSMTLLVCTYERKSAFTIYQILRSIYAFKYIASEFTSSQLKFHMGILRLSV